MIVVTGATGQLGRLVIASLLKKVPAKNIVAAVRDVEKAADLAALGVVVRSADYTRPETWEAALEGAEKVLLISSNEIGQRAAQHRTVINAAAKAKVGLLAYTSVLRADTSPLGLAGEHKETEEMIMASGLPYVILRNGWYTENHTMAIGAALEHGAVFGCAGEGAFSTASRQDYADAAVAVLTEDGHAGKVYELAGDVAYTLTELAAEFGRQSGKAVVYNNLSEAEYKGLLLQIGLPEVLAELLANSDTGASLGGLYDNSGVLARLIGRGTTPLSETVSAALGK